MRCDNKRPVRSYWIRSMSAAIHTRNGILKKRNERQASARFVMTLRGFSGDGAAA